MKLTQQDYKVKIDELKGEFGDGSRQDAARYAEFHIQTIIAEALVIQVEVLRHLVAELEKLNDG